MTTFARRRPMVRNTISSKSDFVRIIRKESVQICGICGQKKVVPVLSPLLLRKRQSRAV